MSDTCPTCGREFKKIRLHWGRSDCPVPEDAYYDCPHNWCHESFKTAHELTTHEQHHPVHRDTGYVCQQCGHRYDNISGHWGSEGGSCSYPEFTERQHEIIRGLLMGDGTAPYYEDWKNPCIKVVCIVPRYLQYLTDQFGVLATKVYLDATGAESAESNRKYGFRPDANDEDYSPLFRVTTLSHPSLWEYRNWYESGEKVWPEDLHLSPETLTHWYCGDGSLHSSNAIRITMTNERENTDKVEQYFERVGLPTPTWYTPRGDCIASWKKAESEELFEYMVGPITGYEYKWPESFK